MTIARGKGGRFRSKREVQVTAHNDALHKTHDALTDEARALERDLWGWVPVSMRPSYVAPASRSLAAMLDKLHRRTGEMLGAFHFHAGSFGVES